MPLQDRRTPMASRGKDPIRFANLRAAKCTDPRNPHLSVRLDFREGYGPAVTAVPASFLDLPELGAVPARFLDREPDAVTALIRVIDLLQGEKSRFAAVRADDLRILVTRLTA